MQLHRRKRKENKDKNGAIPDEAQVVNIGKEHASLGKKMLLYYGIVFRVI